MSAQTSYSLDQSIAYAGLIFAQSPHDIISRSVETAGGVDFGVAVSRGTNKNRQCVVGASDFIGISIRSLEREGAANTGEVKYREKETAGIMRNGYIWVICPSGCNAGDKVKCSTSTGVIDAGDAGAGETQILGAVFDTTASAGELAVVRIQGLTTVAGS